jgi:hypothetical protein
MDRTILFTLEEVVQITSKYSYYKPINTVQTVKGSAKLDFEGNVLDCQIDNITMLDEEGTPRKQLAFEGTKTRLKNAVLNILQKIKE